jgi:hypothetical protein
MDEWVVVAAFLAFVWFYQQGKAGYSDDFTLQPYAASDQAGLVSVMSSPAAAQAYAATGGGAAAGFITAGGCGC